MSDKKRKTNRPKNLYVPVSVTVPRQTYIDKSAVLEALEKLGLKTEAQRKQFSDKYNYGDIVAYCLKYVHFGKNFTGVAKAARLAGQVTVTINVAIEIVNQIKSFLGQVVQEIGNRVEDAGRQVGTGLKEGGDGIVKNHSEGLNNMDRGGGRALGGTFNAMTVPVGSNRFYQGLNDASDGLVEFGTGFGKFFIQTQADFTVMFGGRLISGLQTLVGMESIGRGLNQDELNVLTPVFGGSVEYSVIRIKAGYAGVINIGKDNGEFTLYNNNRALTHGNTIYMKNKAPASVGWYNTLVHETTHVWQNQNGGTDYMLEALYAQEFGNGYDYDDGISKGKNWAMLNPEQQGKLIEVAYAGGFFQTGIFKDENGNVRPDLTTYMQKVLPMLRAGQGAT